MQSEDGATGTSRAAGLIYLLFFLSGFCGLVYEIIWIRRFAVSFGNTTYAITVVLAAFMGGLAAGSRWFGALADNPRRRAALLSWYGWMEIGIGLYCLLFENLIAAQNSLLARLYHTWDPSAGLTLGLKFLLSVALLLFPTILMGGTLPVLIKSLSRRLPEVGRITGKLYFVNCLGAVFGTLAVAFWMIPALGLALSTAVAAALNIGVGLSALALRGKVSDPAEPPALPADNGADSRSAPDSPHVLGWVLFGISISGFTAMVYEIAWTRVLAMVLGSSTYSFSVMLAAFISGIALGSYIVSRGMHKIRYPAFFFALCQLAVGLTVLGMLPLYSRMPLFFLWCRQVVNFTYESHEALKFVVSLVVMLVPATFCGMGFPLASRIAAGEFRALAGKVGGVYALNTLGNILGSVLCTFLMIPLLGLKLTLESAVILNLTAGFIVLAALGGQRRAQLHKFLLFAALALASYYLLAPGWDRYLLSGGAFRYHNPTVDTPEYFAKSAHAREILFYKEGVSVTVAVERLDTLLMLRVNGKVDASTGMDMNTQILLAHLPLLLHPNPARVLVIGAGSGVTCGSALAHASLRDLCCVEISPEVIEASRFFADQNRRYWEDPRTEIVIDDGRNFLFRDTTRWDVITSEPSNPWIAGIGNLYAAEFYRTCRDRLAPGGILCQWIHLYEMDEKVLKTIVRTFQQTFPHTLAFSSIEQSDLMLVGTAESPPEVDFDRLTRRMEEDPVARDLDRVGIQHLFTLLSTQVFDERGLFLWAGIGPANTDNFPLVEYQAPRGFYLGSQVILPGEYRLAGGKTLLNSYLRGHTVSAEELVEVARYQMPTGPTDMVYSALTDALRAEPDNRSALDLLARLLIDLKKYAEAEETLRRLAATGAPEKERLELEYSVALAFSQRRAASFVNPADYTRPLQIKLRQIELDSTRSLLRFNLGEIYEYMRDYTAAAAAFEAALSLRETERRPTSPEPSLILHRIGQAWLNAGIYDKAAQWYERLAREYPENSLGRDMLNLIPLEKLLHEGGALDAGRVRQELRP